MFDGHQRNKPCSSQSESSIQVQPSGKAEKYGQRRAAVSLKVDERVLKQWPGKSNDQQQVSVTKKGTTRQLRSSSSSSAKESPPSSATIQLITSESSTEELPFSSLSTAQVEPRVGPNSSSSVESDNSENCDRGTPVTLEAVVWHESEGLLVVKVMWRNKVFVGSLMDSTTHQWTPLNRKETERMGPRTRTMRKAHGLSNSLSTIRKQSLRRGFLSNETSGLEASSGAGHSRTRAKVIDTKQQPQEQSIETRDASHTASDDSPKASKRSRLFPKSNTISSDGATPSSIVTDELAVGTFPIPPLIPINLSSSLSTTATTNSEDVRDSVNPISNDRPPPLTKETCKETTFQGGSSFYQNDIPLDLAGNHPSPNIDELDRTGIENPPFPPITQGTVLREHCNLREDSQGVLDSDEDLEIIYENLHQPLHLEFKEKLQFIGGTCMENQMNHKMHQQHPNPKMEFLNLPAREPYRQNEIFPDNGRTAYSVDQPLTNDWLMKKFSNQTRMGSIEMGCCKRSTKLTIDSRPFSQRFFTKNLSDPQPEMQNKANIESTHPSPANNI